MAKQGICIHIDIRHEDTGAGEKSSPSSDQRQVKYVALDERGVVRLDKLYSSATPQNSIDFLKQIMAQITIPINSILTDSGLEFNEAFTRYLTVCRIQHKRKSPYVPDMM